MCPDKVDVCDGLRYKDSGLFFIQSCRHDWENFIGWIWAFLETHDGGTDANEIRLLCTILTGVTISFCVSKKPLSGERFLRGEFGPNSLWSREHSTMGSAGSTESIGTSDSSKCAAFIDPRCKTASFPRHEIIPNNRVRSTHKSKNVLFHVFF